MVDTKLQKIIKRYSVTLENEKIDERSNFLSIKSARGGAPIIVHYLNNRIYAVRFLNNEFFEVPDEWLYSVISSLLSGEYEVKQSLMRRKQHIVVLGNKDISRISPERIYPSSALKGEYSLLPASFPQK